MGNTEKLCDRICQGDSHCTLGCCHVVRVCHFDDPHAHTQNLEVEVGRAKERRDSMVRCRH